MMFALDPKKIDIRRDEITIQALLDRLEKHLDEPHYELERCWDDKHMSQFIESIIIHIPVMPIWIRIDGNDDFTIVDGVKRVKALQRFISDGWRLSDLEYVTDFNDRTYAELPRSIQRRGLETPVQLYYICPGTGIQEAVNISNRIRKD